MTPTLSNLLSDTGETDAVPEDTPSPAELEKLAAEPATMLWTLRVVQRYSAHCWAKRWIRNFRYWLLFGLGLVAALQIAGFWVFRTTAQNFELRTAATVRATVEQVLREHKISSGLPAPTTGVAVATVP